MAIDFETAAIPGDIPPEADAGAASGYTCDECGKPLSYGGRGRPPTKCDEHKRAGSSGRSSAPSGNRGSKDVDAACNALAAAYESLLFPLGMASPDAAAMWVQKIGQLNNSNRLILSGDPALARRIVNSASKGGAAALIATNAMAMAPVFILAFNDVKTNRRAARARRQEYENVEDGGITVPIVDPDAAFRR